MSRPTDLDAGDDWLIAPLGIWLEARSTPLPAAGPGLFLDRDGVIVDDTEFLAALGDVELVPDAAELIVKANRCAVPVAVVTNQSGIARQLFGWAAFADVEREITAIRFVASSANPIAACTRPPRRLKRAIPSRGSAPPFPMDSRLRRSAEMQRVGRDSARSVAERQ